MSRITTFSALSNPSYRLYWASQLASSAAVLILSLARGWLVYDMTNSPFLLGVVVGAFSIPIMVLALPGGAIADRVNKRDLMVISEAVAAFLNLGIALLIATNLISVWHLILASLISGIAFSFGQPAKQAIVSEIVSPAMLMNAISLGSTGFNMMRVLAPAAGGFLLAFLGMAPVYFIGTILTLAGVVFLLLLPRGDPIQEGSMARLGDDTLQGLKYLYQNKIIFTLMLITFLPTLLAQPFQFLLPIFARDIYEVGAVGLGWMTATIGLGSIIATLITASLGDYQRKAHLLLYAVGFLGFFLVMFSFSPIFVLSLPFLLLLGLCGTGYNTVNNTMLQIYSSREMRGRAMSIMTITFGMAPLGTVPMGAVAESIGAPLTFAIGGALVSLAVIAIALFNPAFRRLK